MTNANQLQETENGRVIWHKVGNMLGVTFNVPERELLEQIVYNCIESQALLSSKGMANLDVISQYAQDFTLLEEVGFRLRNEYPDLIGLSSPDDLGVAASAARNLTSEGREFLQKYCLERVPRRSYLGRVEKILESEETPDKKRKKVVDVCLELEK